MASGQDLLWLTYYNCSSPNNPAGTYPDKNGTGSGYKFIGCEPYWGKDDREAEIEIAYNLTQTRVIPVVQRGSSQYFDVQDQSFARTVPSTGGTVTFSGECNFEYIYVDFEGSNAQSSATTIPGRNDGLQNWTDEGWDSPGHWWGISEPTGCTVTATVRGYNPKDEVWETGTITRTLSGGSWSSAFPIEPATAIDSDCTDITVTLSIAITTGVLPTKIDFGGEDFPNLVCAKVSNSGTGHTADTPVTAYCSLKVV